MVRMGKFKIPIYILMIFVSISIGLWIWFNNAFYFFNFMYIGIIVSFGLFLLIKKYKYSNLLRYIMFLVSILFVSALFFLRARNIEVAMFWSFIAGNIIYCAVGIIMAFILKDNRAFCKYICPITVFLKPASYFSVLRVKADSKKCISCGKCKKVCPMNVDILDGKRSREN